MTSKKKESKKQKVVHETMTLFKEGKLKSGSGATVTSRDQAIAIGMSAGKKKSKGKKK